MNTNKTTIKNTTISLFLLPFIYSMSAFAISATTANTIQGKAPYLLADINYPSSKVSDAINFTVAINGIPTTFYGNSVLPAKGFAKTQKFNQFIPSFQNTQYSDDDGDLADTTTITHSAFTIEWKDKYGNVIPVSDYGNQLSSCYSPYQLTISAANVNVHSKYGDPNSNSLGTLSHTFAPIYVDDYNKICGIRPSNMDWFKADGLSWQNNTGTGIRDTIYGGGYDTTQFDPLLGFKANLSTKFPTTAFPNAEFSILVPEPQTDYTISLTSGSGVILTQATSQPSSYVTVGNKIKFSNTKPSNSMTIKVKHSSGWTYLYTFNPNLWGVAYGKRPFEHPTDPIADGFCSLFSRAELTNSPQTTFSPGDIRENYFNAMTRELGTFTSEWGAMNTYSNSGIGWGSFWTSETYDTLNQHSVHLGNGSSYPLLKTDMGSIFCKE